MKSLLLVFAMAVAVSQGFADDAPNLKDQPPGTPDKKEVSKTGAVKLPKVSFESPKDGATVSQKFKVKFKVDGMTIKPANTMEPGTGHHHLIIDGAAIPKGQVVPKDEKNLHFGKGETETEITLKPGEHTMTLQFADGSHISYGPELSKTIKVKVK